MSKDNLISRIQRVQLVTNTFTPKGESKEITYTRLVVTFNMGNDNSYECVLPVSREQIAVINSTTSLKNNTTQFSLNEE